MDCFQNLATNPLTLDQNTKSIIKLQHERESDPESSHAETLKLQSGFQAASERTLDPERT